MKDKLHLDADGARKMLEGIKPGEVHSLDFSGVETINFAAMRALLFARQQGYKIHITNACDQVATMFENAGVTHYISVNRAAVPIDMSHYSHSGEGYCGVTYYCDDGDAMVKLYNDFLPDSMVEQEKRASTCVLQLGVPTPMPGAIVTTGKQKGILYERIVNKKSFARAIADDPDSYREYAKRFAKMARQLHQTPCNTAIFPDKAKIYENALSSSKVFDAKEKEFISDFLSNVPATTTCNHGDLHIGNIITTGKEDLWIDLAAFSYGNPLFDIGTAYLCMHCPVDAMTLNLFHIHNDLMEKVWRAFICEYFNVKESEVDEVNNKIKPYTGLRMVELLSSPGIISEKDIPYSKIFTDNCFGIKAS